MSLIDDVFFLVLNISHSLMKIYLSDFWERCKNWQSELKGLVVHYPRQYHWWCECRQRLIILLVINENIFSGDASPFLQEILHLSRLLVKWLTFSKYIGTQGPRFTSFTWQLIKPKTGPLEYRRGLGKVSPFTCKYDYLHFAIYTSWD